MLILLKVTMYQHGVTLLYNKYIRYTSHFLSIEFALTSVWPSTIGAYGSLISLYSYQYISSTSNSILLPVCSSELESGCWLHYQMGCQGSFHKRFCHQNSDFIDILFSSHLNCKKVITTEFCTWHNSSGIVMAYAESDMNTTNGDATKHFFFQI